MSSAYSYKDVGVLAYVYASASLVEVLGLLGMFGLGYAGQIDSLPLVTLSVVALMLFRFIVFGAFLYRMNANLRALTDPPLEYTPWGMIGWFFAPIVSLWKPFQAVRELFNHTSDDPNDIMNLTTPGILSAWWGTWILSNVVSFVGDESLTWSVITTAVAVVQIATNVVLVIELTRRMRAHAARCEGGKLEDTVAVFA